MNDTNKNKHKVKREYRGIISDAILELAKTNGLQKKRRAYYVVGKYNFKKNLLMPSKLFMM